MDNTKSVFSKESETQPKSAVEWNDLGTKSKAQGDIQSTIKYFGKALTLDPNYLDAHINLGNVYIDAKQLDRAEASYLRALNLSPNNAVILGNLSGIYYDQGHFDLTIDASRRAIEREPNFPDAYCNLANAHKAKWQTSEAEEYYNMALRLNPMHFVALNNLAHIKGQQGLTIEAIKLYSKAVELIPEFGEAHSNLGFLLHKERKLNEAIPHYKEAIRIKLLPNKLHSELRALKESLSINGQLQCYTSLINVSPSIANTCSNLGVIYNETGKLTEAIQSFREALKLNPNHEHAFCNLERVLHKVCDWTDFDIRAKELENLLTKIIDTNAGWMPMFPFDTMLYPFSHELRKAVAAFTAGLCLKRVQQLNKPSYNFNQESTSNRLRIGYVTSEFAHSSGAHLMQSIPGMHDRNRFEIFCYALNPDDESEFRKKIAKESDHFVDLSKIICHGEAADRIYADGIHILVDMIGYSGGSRSDIFALRPAPIQVMWLGYPGTSGADYMDYIVTDAITSPLELQVKKMFRFFLE